MKKKNVTLSELKNIIKEEIQFQLAKKQLVENLDSKTLKRILREQAESKITYITKLTPSTTTPFRIVNPNSADKITTVMSKNPNDKTYLEVQFIYVLQTGTETPEYQAFRTARDNKSLEKFFFTYNNESLIVPNHVDSLKNTKQSPNLSYKLEMVVKHSQNVQLNLEDFKGQQLTQ